MRHRIDPSDDLLGLARRQGGAISRPQALHLGLPAAALRRLVDHGGWHRLHCGIYAIHPPSDMTWVWGGVLAGGSHAVVAGVWALWLHGLVSDPALPVVIATSAHPRDTERWKFQRGPACGRGEPSRTPVETALIEAWPHLDEAAFLHAVSEALYRRRVTLPGLRRRLGDVERMSRRAELVDLLDDLDGGVRSTLEADYVRRVERAHGLPTARRQHPVRGRPLDALYDEFGLVVEIDGRRGHVGAGAFRDMERDNEHTALGLHTLRFGARDIRRRPCAVARSVADMLTLLGWVGPRTRCRQCAR